MKRYFLIANRNGETRVYELDRTFTFIKQEITSAREVMRLLRNGKIIYRREKGGNLYYVVEVEEK